MLEDNQRLEDNKRLVRRWFEEVWNQGQLDAIDELISPEGVGFGLAEAETHVHGPAGLKIFIGNFRNAFPDIQIKIEDTVADARKVAVRFTATGTHKGDGLGFAGTGHAIKLTGMTIIEIENGMMIHGWNNWDQLGMMQQLGMAPGEVKVDKFLEERV
jgi:steroid delta-isomerase-like uncharacterized protein